VPGRADEGQTADRIEEMAHALFGLPKDERSRAGAREMAEMLAQVAAVRFEKTEEPIMPQARTGGRGTS